MLSLTILYYSLAVGFLVLVGFLCYALYLLSQNLKESKIILENVKDVTTDISLMENRIKLTVLNLIGNFLKKGGDRDGKKR